MSRKLVEISRAYHENTDFTDLVAAGSNPLSRHMIIGCAAMTASVKSVFP